MEELSIKLSGVTKKYRLGQIGSGWLVRDLESWWARKRGKVDPNSRIGMERLVGEDFMALRGIDLEVRKGEALGIIGANGAGKSTLLKLLCRVTAPTSGEIDLWGRVASMLEVGTGFNTEMTGRENIYLNGAILGMTKSEIDAKIEDIIDFSEVREFIDTPVKRYSSGMYVKLAFAVAAHLDNEIMIMDEVLAVGDIAFQRKCLEKMREAATAQGRTVLYVSHNMETIRRLCDRVIVLSEGQIIFDGPTEEAISIYMDSRTDIRNSYDFSSVERPPFVSDKLRMTHLQVTSEPAEFTLTCKASADLEDVKFRFQIFYADGSAVGTCATSAGMSMKAGESYSIAMKLPVDCLIPGKYSCRAIAVQGEAFDNAHILDRVDPALSFELPAPDGSEARWPHRWWGHIKMNEIEINKIDIL